MYFDELLEAVKEVLRPASNSLEAMTPLLNWQVQPPGDCLRW